MNGNVDAVTMPEKVGVDESMVAQIISILRTPAGSTNMPATQVPAVVPAANIEIPRVQ